MVSLFTEGKLKTLTFGFILWFCATLISTPIGAGLSQAALLMSALLSAAWLWRNRAQAYADTRQTVALLLLAAALIMGLSCWHGFKMYMLHAPLLLAVCAIMVGAWSALRIPARALWLGLPAGAIAACCLALYQLLVEHNTRPNGWHNAILFGDIAMALGLMSLAGWVGHMKQATPLKYWLIAGALAGVGASFLSGSRGGWMALVFCFVPLYAYTKSWRVVLGGVLAVAVMAGTLYSIPQTRIAERVALIGSDLAAYAGGNSATSIGARLEMSHAGVQIALANPVLGVGNERFQAEMLALAKSNKIGSIPILVGDYKDTHNELTDAAAKGGVFGLAWVGLLYLAPMLYFLNILKGSHAVARPIALAGLMLVFATIDFGLSVNIFTRHIGKAYYFVFLSLLIGLCSAALREPEKTSKA